MNDLEDIGGLMKELQAAIAQAKLENQGGPVSDQLGELSRELNAAFATVQQEYPRALTDVDQQIADTQREAEATLVQIDAKRQELAEPLAAAAAAETAAPPPGPDPHVDPALGGQMREEIINLFVKPAAADEGKGSHGSLWSVLRRGH